MYCCCNTQSTSPENTPPTASHTASQQIVTPHTALQTTPQTASRQTALQPIVTPPIVTHDPDCVLYQATVKQFIDQQYTRDSELLQIQLDLEQIELERKFEDLRQKLFEEYYASPTKLTGLDMLKMFAQDKYLSRSSSNASSIKTSPAPSMQRNVTPHRSAPPSPDFVQRVMTLSDSPPIPYEMPLQLPIRPCSKQVERTMQILMTEDL